MCRSDSHSLTKIRSAAAEAFTVEIRVVSQSVTMRRLFASNGGIDDPFRRARGTYSRACGARGGANGQHLGRGGRSNGRETSGRDRPAQWADECGHHVGIRGTVRLQKRLARDLLDRGEAGWLLAR